MAESSSLEHQSPHGELRTAFYNPYDIKRRRRTSRSQFKTLEKAFSENPKPNASTRQYLAQRLSMTPRGIQVWFQNRRAKNKQTGTAAHQADPCTSSSYSQRIENNIGQEEKSPFVDSTESRPSGVDFISNRHVSTLTIECSDNFSEPSTTKRVQATQADSMASNFPSSIQSNEPLALKTDMHPLYGSTNVNINANVNNNTIPTSNTEAWSPLQSWSGSVEQSGNSLANFQSLPQPFTFNSPPHSTFGPSAPESLDPPQNAAIPAISQENRPSITLHKSQDNHKEGSQQLNLSTSDLQQSTLNQQPPLYSPNNNTTIKNIAQSLPLHALLPPQPQPSRAERSEVTPTVTTTAAANANVDRTPLIPDTFGYIMSQGDTRGHAFTYPLSRRVSIHETSISSAQNRPKHKVVHALDGLNSSSPSVEIDQIGSRSTQIEVQSKRRKSVSKHFRSSEELSVAGVQMFESMGGITQGDTPSFSESPTSVNEMKQVLLSRWI
ncbi:hypothetical protein FBU30_006222 [Linnemannia zychae]|nr:hypothetical protein FBU30_006222 [Linnemannia zychae]